ncbi:MAG: outer membrane vitamin B12 receptor protein, partial [Alloprevotella sp.]|nr:outer membrane vitamin B12 receptor protein [Prevotellamassilia sp.]MDY5762793.1 outer membrane vitamin B12 receptor protein [Alloprevotella sp.]
MRRCALHRGVVSAIGLWVGMVYATADNVVDVVPSDTLGTAIVVTHRPVASWRSATPAFTLDTLALRQRGVTDVGDALRRLPGVNLRDYGGAGGLKTVSV